MFLVKLLFIILVVLYLISLLSVKIHIVLDTQGEEIYYNVKISVLKFIKYEFNKQKIEKIKRKQKDKKDTKPKQKDKTSFDDVTSMIWAALHAIKYFLKHLKILKFTWNTNIGLTEADKTAITYGYICGGINSIIGFISYHTKFETMPEIVVEPIFGRNTFSTRFDCIISFKVGKAIMTAIDFIKTYIRNKKRKSFKNVEEGETV
ncbi:MAG: hypothetical protein K0S51_122 [Bacillales bacterium]|jgi:hypothetical protein|nr:hypothetical protein [Bacillales bacterium]